MAVVGGVGTVAAVTNSVISTNQAYESGAITADQRDYQYGNVVGNIVGGVTGGVVGSRVAAGVVGSDAVPSLEITKPYSRPTGSTTAAQRASVQNQPCVTCGESAPKMYADHIDPLVVEYYSRGFVDTGKMRNISAVQPQCPSCSSSQGGTLSAYSKDMKKTLGL